MASCLVRCVTLVDWRWHRYACAMPASTHNLTVAWNVFGVQERPKVAIDLLVQAYTLRSQRFPRAHLVHAQTLVRVASVNSSLPAHLLTAPHQMNLSTMAERDGDLLFNHMLVRHAVQCPRNSTTHCKPCGTSNWGGLPLPSPPPTHTPA